MKFDRFEPFQSHLSTLQAPSARAAMMSTTAWRQNGIDGTRLPVQPRTGLVRKAN